MLTHRLATSFAWASLLLFLLFASSFAILNLADDPYSFAILPRSRAGLMGILTSPLLHIRQSHLVANATFILVISTCLFAAFRSSVIMRNIFFAWIFIGGTVWGIGREAFHFGASGVAFALLAFLLSYSFLKFQISYLLLCISVGAIYLSSVPQSLTMASSWESHVAGLAIGLILGFRERKNEVLQ